MSLSMTHDAEYGVRGSCFADESERDHTLSTTSGLDQRGSKCMEKENVIGEHSVDTLLFRASLGMRARDGHSAKVLYSTAVSCF